jgi:hypothetical protein
MRHLCLKIWYNFSLEQKYIIKNFSYLVEAPPTQPGSSYSIYVSEKTSGLKGNPTAGSKAVAESWKNLTSEQKSVYEAKFKRAAEEYNRKKDSYTQKYVIPFKRVNFTSLFLSHLWKDKILKTPETGPITSNGKIFAEKLKNISP